MTCSKAGESLRRKLCANRQCANYKQIVEEERREIRDADGDAESPLT